MRVLGDDARVDEVGGVSTAMISFDRDGLDSSTSIGGESGFDMRKLGVMGGGSGSDVDEDCERDSKDVSEADCTACGACWSFADVPEHGVSSTVASVSPSGNNSGPSTIALTLCLNALGTTSTLVFAAGAVPRNC